MSVSSDWCLERCPKNRVHGIYQTILVLLEHLDGTFDAVVAHRIGHNAFRQIAGTLPIEYGLHFLPARLGSARLRIHGVHA